MNIDVGRYNKDTSAVSTGDCVEVTGIMKIRKNRGEMKKEDSTAPEFCFLESCIENQSIVASKQTNTLQKQIEPHISSKSYYEVCPLDGNITNGEDP